MSGILYTDNDEKACAWLKELVAAGELPAGEVWCRDVTTIKPEEVARFHQRHWFCGVGGWPLALKWADWPIDAPVDTASVPCQPFSCAGKRKGKDDERHLWPIMFNIIRELRPAVVFGEQVASADVVGKTGGRIAKTAGDVWLDGVFGDLEFAGYTTGAVVLGAHSLGAPHKRQRLFWVADMQRHGLEGLGGHGDAGWAGAPAGGMEHAGHGAGCAVHGQQRDQDDAGTRQSGAWSHFDILPCRDGKARRVESQPLTMADGVSAHLDALRNAGLSEDEIGAAVSTFPLTQHAVGRMMLLRGYGNAIVPSLAAEFVRAWLAVKEGVAYADDNAAAVRQTQEGGV